MTTRRRTPSRLGAMAITAMLVVVAACGPEPSHSIEAVGVTTSSRPTDDCPVPDDGAGGALAAARERASMRIGIADERPHGFIDDAGRPAGHGPAVVAELLCRLGVPVVEARTVDFGALVAALDAGRFDVIASGMYVTTERAERVRFTDPYLCDRLALGVAVGNPLGLRDLDDVVRTEARLGVLRGGIEESDAEAAGVDPSRVARLETVDDMFDALEAGAIDALALPQSTIAAYRSDHPGVDSTDEFPLVIDGVERIDCMALATDDPDLAARLDDALDDLRAEGELLELVGPYGYGPEAVARAAAVTLDELLDRP